MNGDFHLILNSFAICFRVAASKKYPINILKFTLNHMLHPQEQFRIIIFDAFLLIATKPDVQGTGLKKVEL